MFLSFPEYFPLGFFWINPLSFSRIINCIYLITKIQRFVHYTYINLTNPNITLSNFRIFRICIF
jgi:hypothetical protein